MTIKVYCFFTKNPAYGEVTDFLQRLLIFCNNILIFRLEGETGILINGSVEGKKDHSQPDVKEFDVYAVDVLVSSGKGN